MELLTTHLGADFDALASVLDPQLLRPDDLLDGGDVLSGFSVPVRRLVG